MENNSRLNGRTNNVADSFLGRLKRGVGNFFRNHTPRRLAMGATALASVLGTAMAPAAAASAAESDEATSPDTVGVEMVVEQQPEIVTDDFGSGTITVNIEGNPNTESGDNGSDQTPNAANVETQAEAPAESVEQQPVEQPVYDEIATDGVETPAAEGTSGSDDTAEGGPIPIVDDRETQQGDIPVKELGDNIQPDYDGADPPSDAETGIIIVGDNDGDSPAEEGQDQPNEENRETTSTRIIDDVEPVEIDGEIYYKWEETVVLENGVEVTTYYWKNDNGNVITTDDMDRFYLKIDENKWEQRDQNGQKTGNIIETVSKFGEDNPTQPEEPPEETPTPPEEPPEEPSVPEETPTPPAETPNTPDALPFTGPGDLIKIGELAAGFVALGLALKALQSKLKESDTKPPRAEGKFGEGNKELLHHDKYALERFMARSILLGQEQFNLAV
jgi:hypothetical protein